MARGRKKKGVGSTTAGGVVIAAPAVETVRVTPTWWTVEHGLYAGILLAALVVRFLWLGARPLSPSEAHTAWLAWRNTGPAAHVPPFGVDPLPYALQWLTFLLTGGGDALARLWPALIGALLVLLPYGLREHIGRERALLAALLLALSPQAVYWSRHASGVAFALAASLALVVVVWRWLDDWQARGETGIAFAEVGTWPTVLAVTLALLLMSAPVAYTALVGLAVGLWPRREALAQAWHDLGAVARRRLALAFLITIVGLGAVFLTDIVALGNVADVAGRWLAGFWQAAGYPWYWVPFRLLADEPLLVVLAVWGGVRAWRARDHLGRLWLAWATAGLILGFRPGHTSADVAILVVPLAFLAADALWAGVEMVRRPSPTWREETVLAAAFFVILAFWFMMIAGYLAVAEDRYIPAILVVPLLLVALALMYGFWLGWTATQRVLLVSLFITGAIWTWMALWVQNLHLNAPGALDARPGIERTTTHPNVRLMVQTLERISAETATDWHEAEIDAVLRPDDDVLRWYLREFRNLREVPSVKSVTANIAIAHKDEPELAGYTGMDWIVTITQLPTDLGGRIYHWWFYREAPLPAERDEVVVWYKGDHGR